MAGKKNGKKSENDKETKVTIDYDISKGGFQFDAGELQQALHNGAVVKEEQVISFLLMQHLFLMLK